MTKDLLGQTVFLCSKCLLRATTASSGHLAKGVVGGRQTTPRSAKEMLDGQNRRVDIAAHAKTANKVLLQKKLEEDLC